MSNSRGMYLFRIGRRFVTEKTWAPTFSSDEISIYDPTEVIKYRNVI